MKVLSPLPKQKFFNNNGQPMAGGLLFTYAAGTSDKITTWKDADGSEENTNPIELDFRGECDLWITQGTSYKYVLSPPEDTDPPTNPIWTEDDISLPSSGGGVQSVVAGTNVTVNATDPENPIVSASGLFAGFAYVGSGGTLISNRGVSASARSSTGHYTVTVDPSFFSGYSIPDIQMFVSVMSVSQPTYGVAFFVGSNVFEVDLRVYSTDADTDETFSVLIVPVA